MTQPSTTEILRQFFSMKKHVFISHMVHLGQKM